MKVGKVRSICALLLLSAAMASESQLSSPGGPGIAARLPDASAADSHAPRTLERDFLGSRFALRARPPDFHRRPQRRLSSAADTLRYWNEIALDASGVDHTPPAPGEDRQFGEQLGPGRSSRAMAIVHIAMFDAVTSIVGGYRSYTGIRPAPRWASVDAAIARAAHATLVELYPSQYSRLNEIFEEDMRNVVARHPLAVTAGLDAGRRAAATILAMREHDRSGEEDPKLGAGWVTSDEPGHWREDPIGASPIALGAKWGKVRPFLLQSGAQFRAPAPPSMLSEAYTRAFIEAKTFGGDGVATPTDRTAEQTEIGIFWAYDGTPSLCAPPRLYNQIAAEISRRSDDVAELARLFALINVAMADAGIAIWESKYHYDFWRPVTAIREADEGAGPSGAGDGNPDTVGDPSFVPLGAPASNLTGPNFTPPFPAYPSGHAGLGSALFQILRRYYGTDRIAFSVVSDELNGETVGNDGTVRPYHPRSFDSLSQAEEENAQSRIYLGIHWEFDKTAGIAMGRRIADYVFDRAFQPIGKRSGQARSSDRQPR